MLHDGLRRGRVLRELIGTQPRDPGTGCARDFGYLHIVSGHEHVEIRHGQRLCDRPHDEGFAGDVEKVLARYTLRAAARGDHTQHYDAALLTRSAISRAGSLSGWEGAGVGACPNRCMP